MRFNCGLTAAEKYEAKVRKKQDWHLKFAWWPVRVGKNDCRWFEYVDRRGHLNAWWDGIYWTYEYRPATSYYW